MTDSWHEELLKHPFISSNLESLILIETPGKGIYLMKQRAKIYKSRSNNKTYELGAKLACANLSHDDPKSDGSYITERRKLADGTAEIVQK